MATWRYPIELYSTQREAVASQADQVLFGGSLAGGKTELLLKHLVDVCSLIPGVKVLIIRKSFPQMVEIEQRLRLRIPKTIATLNKSDHVMTFKHNDAEIHLGYLDSDDAAERFQGHQYAVIAFDELTHYDKSWVDRVTERLRDPEREPLMAQYGLRVRMLAASNPGSRGHGWVKERFVDPAPAGQLFEVPVTDEGGSPMIGKDGKPIVTTRQFIRSSLWDNPFINPDTYLASMGEMDPERKRAMIYGDWGIPAGVRFPQFRERIHVINPEDLPIDIVGHARVCGVDFGFNDPYAAVWMAKVHGVVVVYREDQATELTDTQQAQRVLALSDEGDLVHGDDLIVPLDEAAWRRSPQHVGAVPDNQAPLGSMARAYMDVLNGKGAHVVKATHGPGSRAHRWATLDRMLAVDETTGLPGILIYDNCRQLIKAIQSAPRDKRKPDDVDTKWKDDHILDALSYGYMELLGRDYHRKPPASEQLRRDARNMPVTAGVQSAAF